MINILRLAGLAALAAARVLRQRYLCRHPATALSARLVINDCPHVLRCLRCGAQRLSGGDKWES